MSELVNDSVVAVALGDRSYDITIGDGLLDRFDFSRVISGRDVLIVCGKTPGALYLGQLKSNLQRLAASRPLRLQTIEIDDGEHLKTLASAERVLQTLAKMQASRDVTLLALGGGVIGDLTGFVASIWMRGVRFVQVPTTLLAMVDSSVGGKTAVNLPEGKNLVGAFWQPAAVVADIGTLRTLPDAEFRAGMAEVIKYGALGDVGFFEWLERHAEALMQQNAALLAHAIRHSAQMKADIVMRDERETGERMLLNLGHTFGHAIESAMHYQGILHGEAVAIGMQRQAELSSLLGLAPVSDAKRLSALLANVQLPQNKPAELAAQTLLDLMRLDKKAVSGHIRLILWHGIGRAHIGAAPDDMILQAWDA